MANNQHSIFKKDESSKFIEQHRENVKSDLISITEAILENILLKHLSKLSSRTAWLLPFSILISVVLTLSTSTFHDSLNIPANVWQAFFLLLLLVSIAWFFFALVRLVVFWKESSLNSLIEKIKNTDKK